MNLYRHIKKASFLFMLCTIIRAAAFSPLSAAENTLTESMQGSFSGDYVVYRDYSWKAATWVGFLYYNDETYGAFLYTPETKSRIAILFSVKPEAGTLTLVGQKIISAVAPQDNLAVNYLMTLLPKFYELRVLPNSNNTLFGVSEKKAQFDEFGGDVILHFNSYIPIFHLKTIHNVKKGLAFELTETGNIRESGDQTFYTYEPVQSAMAENHFKRDKFAKTETVTVNGIELHLDSQWKKIADNSFLCGNTAFLTVTSVRLPSGINGDTLSAQEQFIRLLVSSSPSIKILLPYTTIDGDPNLFILQQSIYDMELKKLTKDIKRCIKNQDGSFTVISLTVDSYAYNAEKNYFDRLF